MIREERLASLRFHQLEHKLTKAFDAIVIGAGFAGLVAARDLGDRGLNVVVLEARDRVGGRAWSRDFPEAGQRVELGGTWFDPTRQHCIREEAERYGQALAPKTDASPAARGRGQPPPAIERGELAEILLDAFLIFFTADAQGRLRPGFEALDRNLFPTLVALTEGSFLDPLERLADLVEEHLLAPAQTKRERLQVLAGR